MSIIFLSGGKKKKKNQYSASRSYLCKWKAQKQLFPRTQSYKTLKNKYHLWGSKLRSFRFVSDHQAEVSLDYFTLSSLKLHMVYIFSGFAQDPNEYWVIHIFISISQIWTMKLESTVVCMTHHRQWWIASSLIKHSPYTHTHITQCTGT